MYVRRVWGGVKMHETLSTDADNNNKLMQQNRAHFRGSTVSISTGVTGLHSDLGPTVLEYPGSPLYISQKMLLLLLLHYYYFDYHYHYQYYVCHYGIWHTIPYYYYYFIIKLLIIVNLCVFIFYCHQCVRLELMASLLCSCTQKIVEGSWLS